MVYSRRAVLEKRVLQNVTHKDVITLCMLDLIVIIYALLSAPPSRPSSTLRLWLQSVCIHSSN